MKKESKQSRINEILRVLIAYARLDFSKQIELSGDGQEMDAIGAGINMLGEELNASVISLREKEVMLREIHHRVKNNLQVISSLLNLQIEKDTHAKVRHYARESQNRIRAISLIHEMLYQSSDFKNTNLKAYVNHLSEILRTTYAMPGSRIEIINGIPAQVYFDIDKMIPLGLILNESISNSIKHAFGHKKGEITVTLSGNGKEMGRSLRIADNGKGLKKGFDVNRDGQLGMQLIFLLAEQFGGRMVMSSEAGVSYDLQF